MTIQQIQQILPFVSAFFAGVAVCAWGFAAFDLIRIKRMLKQMPPGWGGDHGMVDFDSGEMTLSKGDSVMFTIGENGPEVTRIPANKSKLN